MSLQQLRRGQTDHSFRDVEDWVERYQPTLPHWHRGVVWDPEVQAKFVRSWLDGDAKVVVAFGRHFADSEIHLFLDGLNSFHAVRTALAEGRLERKQLTFHTNGFRVELYQGTDEELRRVTYLLNRGSPCAWNKQQLPR